MSNTVEHTPSPPKGKKDYSPKSATGNQQQTQSSATQKAGAKVQQSRAKVDVVLGLINDPATATQFERHYLELVAALAPFKNGFTPAVAIDGVPQIISFLVQTLDQEEQLDSEDVEFLTRSLSLMLQRSAFPIVCTTLEDQRKHDIALEQVLGSVSLALRLPQRPLRIAATIVLRQIFSFIRQQCSDDMLPQSVQFHKKKEYQKSITEAVVLRILQAWEHALEQDNAIELSGVPEDEDSEGEGEDEAAANKGPSGQKRNCGPELVAVCKAVQELSYYRVICHRLLENNATALLFATMDRCAAGERALSIVLELLWNMLYLDETAATVMGTQENIDTLHHSFVQTLQLGYMLKDRELRNDFIIVFSLLIRHEPNIEYFQKMLPLLLDLFCGPEMGRTNPDVNPTYHDTVKQEEHQMKKLGWDLLDRMCDNDHFAHEILEWGFIDAIISYINVHCDATAVVRWSTLQLLDLQAHSLRTLSSLAVMGADFFSAASGAEIVHEYIAECPDVQLRNLGVSVLARTATTNRRRELVHAGSIPLALALLRDTGDNALRVECLNLLADIVDRSEDLQSVFLDCDGVRTVLPLMTLNPDYYTELLDTVTFAAVDCIWSSVFGNPSSESAFLTHNGLNSLLTVMETCHPWMLSFPLSCLADFLQNPEAVKIFRKWVSPRSGKSATQLLISFWGKDFGDFALQATQTDAVTEQGPLSQSQLLESSALGVTSNLSASSPSVATGEGQFSGLSALGTSTVSHLKPKPTDDTPLLFEQPITIERVGLEKVPVDIQFLANKNSIHFKLHVALSLVGFEDHKELDDLEKGTLVTIGRFVDLCKDEIWSSVATSLENEGIRPTTPDGEKIRLLRLTAESRATAIMQSHERHRRRHEERQAESEHTFYKSLIKKTEEKAVGTKKAVGLSITEAKIRKAQMLKQSFKSALAKQDALEEPTEEEFAAAEALRQQQEQEDTVSERSGGRVDQTSSLERWGPGQRAMTDTEYNILQALNTVRTNPLSLIPLLEDKLKYLNAEGNAFHLPNRDPETCVEGSAAFYETIDFIKTVRPLVTLLDVPMGMLYATRDHVNDLSRRMDVSQNGSDGSTPLTRMQRYGKPGSKYAQLLSLAHSDPIEMLMNLIVNDGVKSRVDRKNIFDPDMRVCGIAIGPHSIHEVVCVFLVAQEYTEKPLTEQAAVHRKHTPS